jgi:hypothetical protein
VKRISRVAGLLFAGALAASSLAVGMGSAQAEVTPVPGQWYELYTLASQTVCLDVKDGSTSAGAGIQMYHCHGYADNGNPQRWVFVHVSDGSYQIENVGSHMCLTPSAARFIEQFPCDTARGQEWRMFSDPGAPNFHLQNIDATDFPNSCMIAPVIGTHLSTSVRLGSCDDVTDYEYWKLG